MTDDSAVASSGWRPPRWAWPVTLLCALVGIGVATYLTYAHYTTATVLACPDTGVVNCAKVTTSPQSVIMGVPVAVIGLAYFVVMAIACTPWVWRMQQPWIRWARLGATGAGVLMVIYLVYVELFKVDAICLYCTAIHIVMFVLFALTLAATAFGEVEDDAA